MPPPRSHPLLDHSFSPSAAPYAKFSPRRHRPLCPRSLSPSAPNLPPTHPLLAHARLISPSARSLSPSALKLPPTHPLLAHILSLLIRSLQPLSSALSKASSPKHSCRPLLSTEPLSKHSKPLQSTPRRHCPLLSTKLLLSNPPTLIR